VLLVWCHLLTGYEPGLVCDNLCKMVPRPPLPMVQVHGERVSSKGHEFELLSVCTLYICGSVAGRLQVRGSVRYITHNSCAISVVPPFNTNYRLIILLISIVHITLCIIYTHYSHLCILYALYIHLYMTCTNSTDQIRVRNLNLI